MCDIATKKVPCKKCRKMTSVEYGWEEGERSVKGVTVRFTMKTAYCAECHERVWSGEAEDYNLDAAHRAYCEKEGLILPDDVRKLMKKYSIGAKPLCDILGWGEATIGRYLNGFLPTREYSDTLLGLLNDENSFYDRVERNRDRLTPAAYDKIMKTKQSHDDNEIPSGTLPCVFLNEPGQKSVTLCRVSADRKTLSVSAESLAALKKMAEEKKNRDGKEKHVAAFKLPIRQYSF